LQLPRLRILYDNYPLDVRCVPDWGFALLLEWPELRLLFDSGAQGDILLNNMYAVGFDPATLDAVFISHNHWDHQGGLDALLEIKPQLKVFIHSRFSASFTDDLRHRCKHLHIVEERSEIMPGIFSSGPLEAAMPEQSLFVPLAEETLIVTGCAHPGLEAVLDAVQDILPGKRFRLVGGLHLKSASQKAIRETALMMLERRVYRIAPCHCSGDEARAILPGFPFDECLISGVGGKL